MKKETKEALKLLRLALLCLLFGIVYALLK